MLEVFNLALAVLLVGVAWLALVVVGHRAVGSKVATGSRDGDVYAGQTIPARLDRALTNSYHSLSLFTAATAVVVLADAGTGLTVRLGWIYLAARALYLLAYAYDLNPWRSVTFTIGFGATMAMIAVALLPYF